MVISHQRQRSLKPGPNSTSKSQPSKFSILTEEKNTWVQSSANTCSHKEQHNDLPYMTHLNTMGYQNISTRCFWNRRVPCYTLVSCRKTYGEKQLIVMTLILKKYRQSSNKLRHRVLRLIRMPVARYCLIVELV
jgi:hypothetical protein